MVSTTDEGASVRFPALQVELVQEDYLEDVQFDFFGSMIHLAHPVDQAFVVFSAIKRLLGLSKNRTKRNIVRCLMPATPLTTRVTGISDVPRRKRSICFKSLPDGTPGCKRSWDNVLGKNWDRLPVQNSKEGGQRTRTTLIKSMTFMEKVDFGTSLIFMAIQTSDDSNEDCRAGTFQFVMDEEFQK